MTTQTSQALDAWVRLLHAHAAATRELSSELVAEHGLTINDYEALLRLARAEERRMRRIDLASALLLTASGVTRLLDGLENAGLVERGICESDRRVIYAVLTETGRAKLEEASVSHIAAVEALFRERFSNEEVKRLAELLGRLPEGPGTAEECVP